jgi:hypothetical protein
MSLHSFQSLAPSSRAIINRPTAPKRPAAPLLSFERVRAFDLPTTAAAASAILVVVAIEQKEAAMARTLVRRSLYEEDFLAWTEQQAALLRAGLLEQLDLDNLAEELDTMGRSEWGELENRLEVLLMHMLKGDHQPARRSRSWKATMREQRNAIRRLLRRSPSLKRDLETTIAEVYPGCRGPCER